MNAVPSDFNDAMALYGSASLKQAIDNATAPPDIIATALSLLSVDAGAMFEPDVLIALREVRSNDYARFARIRSDVKAAKTVSLVEFDRLTATTADGTDPDMFPDVEPWSHPVNGAELLREIVAAIQQHVIADLPTLYASALWAVHTWLIDRLTISPIANVTAPEMRCGKSVLLTALGKLSYRPLQVANIAPAALFRAIEAWQPTLLIDEVDTFLREHEEARGILNSGFTRDSAFVIRCTGDDHTPTKFSTWGAKALCGIGKIADTLSDRSIPLRLRRKTPSESVYNIRHSDPATWEELRARIARWSDDHRDKVGRARPAPVEGLNDRANDCWEPLLAIAEAVGEEWPKLARLSAAVLHGLDGDAPSIGAQLLGDIKDAFGGREKLFTAALLTSLVEDQETPWPTWNRGRPMTARQLSSRLGEFGIRPNTIRLGSAVGKGYALDQFADAFGRYLSADTPRVSVTSLQTNGGAASSDFLSVTSPSGVTDEKARKPNSGAGCNGVTDRTPPLEEWEGET